MYIDYFEVLYNLNFKERQKNILFTMQLVYNIIT